MKNNRKFVLFILLVIILGLFYLVSFILNDDENVVAREEIIRTTALKEEEFVKVDIKGAVKKPGVYEVNNGMRVIDVIEKAGGLSKSANTEYINLAKTVTDEMTIWIYTDKEIEKFEESNIKYEYIEKDCNCPSVENSACIDSGTSDNTKININTATLEELMTLSGIGEAKAKDIIEYREKTPFSSIEELKNVSGIGDSSFEKIKNNITI